VNKSTDSKLFFYVGVAIYFIALVLGGAGFTTISLILFVASYLALFLWSVSYKTDQLSKGFGLVLIGSGFVGVLGFAIGFSNIGEDIKPLLFIPDNLTLSYSVFMAIVAASFTGAGGSVLANVATNSSTDSPVGIKNEENSDVKAIKEKVDSMMKALILLFVIVVLGFFGVIAAVYFK